MGKRKVSIFSVFVLIIGLSGLGVGVFSLYTTQQLVNRVNTPKPLARVLVSSSYLISDTAWETVNFDVVDYDKTGDFNLVTDEFTCSSSGYYLISAMLTFVLMDDGDVIFVRLVREGVYESGSSAHASQANSLSVGFTDIVYLNAGDSLELQVFQLSGGPENLLGSTAGTYTYLTIAWIGG